MSTSVHKAASPPLGGRLAFERAIRRSSLPAPARHVALTIATWADVASGVIPERFQPSLSTLAEATGMGATTVKRHLGVLESEGWLLRDRPEIARARKEHARTKYALTVPVAAVEHGPERAIPRSAEGHAMGRSGPTHGPERAKAWSAAGHKSSCSTDESPGSTSSSPELVEPDPPTAPEATEGGGGDHALRATATHIADHLDYRGKPPTKTQRETIVDRLVVWLEAGWSAGGLAVVLDIGGQEIRHAPTVYAHRLDPEQMPAPEAAAPVAAGGVRGPVLTGAQVEALTYDDVFGPARSAGHQSYRNPADQSVYDAPWPMSTADKRVAQAAALAAQLQAEDAADLPPWCGNYDCDPVTRTRDGRDDNGLPFVYPCVVCHPERAAA